MCMNVKQFFYLGLPTLIIVLLYISDFGHLVKLIGIAIMSIVFLMAIIISEVCLMKKKLENNVRRAIMDWFALFFLILFMLCFFSTLFLGILNIKNNLVFEISQILFLIYMILEVCITINERIIGDKKVAEVNSNDSCKLILLFLSGLVLLWFFMSDRFLPLYSELIILERNILIAFSNFLLLAFCVNLICAFSFQTNKKLLAMKLFFVSLLLVFVITNSLYLWFDEDVANGIIVILAGIIGGMLTLLGVLWTIRREDHIRKDDEKVRNKPYLVLIQGSSNVNLPIKSIRVTDLKIKEDILSSFMIARESDSSIIINNSEVKSLFSFERCIIKNSENAICLVRGVEIDNIFMELKKPFLLDKNEEFSLFGKDIWFSVQNEDLTASIIVADTNGNNYSVGCELIVKTQSIQRKESNRLIVSVGTVYVINEIGLSFDY